MSRAAALLFACLVGCRAAPIPLAARYPAGTPLVPHYVELEGEQIRYVDTGRGTPVIFVHGFGASLYAWRKTLAPVAAAGFRALAYDNRGFGSSAKPAQGYSNAAYARLLLEFMDSLGLADAVLVGHSMGGAIVAEVAIAQPERVRGLVLIDAAGFGVRAPVVLRLASTRALAPLVAALRGRWITARLLRSTYANPHEVMPEDVDQYYAPVAERDFGQALRGVLREFRFDALRGGRLAGVQTPTLALWGEEDRWIPPVLGMALAADLPRVAFVLVPHAGHAAAEEEPAEVNRLLIAFLREGVPGVPRDLALAGAAQRR